MKDQQLGDDDKRNELATGIEKPHEHDVVSGRGNYSTFHAGNLRFRSIISKIKVDYMGSSYIRKKDYARLVVKQIKSLDPPGRFLKRDETSATTRSWYELDEKQALAKTRQALRERASNTSSVENSSTTEKKKVAKSILRRGGYLEDRLEDTEDVDTTSEQEVVQKKIKDEQESSQQHDFAHQSNEFASQKHDFSERMKDYFKQASEEVSVINYFGRTAFRRGFYVLLSSIEYSNSYSTIKLSKKEQNYKEVATTNASNHCGYSSDQDYDDYHFVEQPKLFLHFDDTGSASIIHENTCCVSNTTATASISTASVENSNYDYKTADCVFSSSTRKNGGNRWHNYHSGEDAQDYVAYDMASGGGDKVCSAQFFSDELSQKTQKHQQKIQPLMYQQQQQQIHEFDSLQQKQLEQQQIRIQNNHGRRLLQQQMKHFPRGILERFGGNHSESQSDRSSCSTRKRSHTEVSFPHRSDFGTTQQLQVIRSGNEDSQGNLLSPDRMPSNGRSKN